MPKIDSAFEQLAAVSARLGDASVDAEAKERALFLWLTAVKDELTDPRDPRPTALTPLQSSLEQFFVQQLLSTTSPVKMTRPLRLLVADILALMLDVGESKSLYSNVNQMMNTLTAYGNVKVPANDVDCVASQICALSIVLEVHGKKAASLVETTLPLMIKIYHYQSDVCARLALQLAQLYLGSHPRLQFQVRAESLQAATRLFSNCYRLSEPLVKSVYKILRSDSGFIHAPQTKIHVMQLFLAVLQSSCSSQFHSVLLPNIDALCKQTLKNMNGVYGVARVTAARLLLALVELFRLNPLALARRLNKLRIAAKEKRSGVADDGSTSKLVASFGFSSVPSGQIAFDLGTTLQTLSAYMLKYHTKDTVLGIFEAYNIILHNIGAAGTQENYTMLVRHFIAVATNPVFDATVEAGVSRSERALADDINLCRRELCAFLLKEVAGKRFLGDQGKIDAVKTIAMVFLQPLASLSEVAGATPGVASSQRVLLARRVIDILVMAMDQMSHLLVDLGRASSGVGAALDVVFALIVGQQRFVTYDVRFHLASAWLVRCIALNVPHRIPRLVEIFVGRADECLAEYIAVAGSDPDGFEPLLPVCYALAHLLSITSYRALYMSPVWLEEIYLRVRQMQKLSARFLDAIAVDTSGAKRLWRKTTVLSHCSWVVYAALMACGPGFVKPHLAQITAAFKGHVGKPPRELSDKFVKSYESEWWMYVIQSREGALSTLHSFICNNTELVTEEWAKKLLPTLSSAISILPAIPPTLFKITAGVCDVLGADAGQTSVPVDQVTLAKMSMYRSLRTHVLLFKKRALLCLEALHGRCGLSPMLYENAHVPVLRLAVDILCGDAIPSASSGDVSRLAQYLSTSDGQVHRSTLARGLAMDVGAFAQRRAKSRDSRLGSFSDLLYEEANSPQSVRPALGSGLRLKRLEGHGPADSLDISTTEGHDAIPGYAWLRGCAENDPWYSFATVPSNNLTEFASTTTPEPCWLYGLRPLPADFSVVDAAIDIFALLFPLQNEAYQDILLEQMAKATRSWSSVATLTAANTSSAVTYVDARSKCLAGSMDVSVNVLLALLAAMRVVHFSSGVKLPVDNVSAGPGQGTTPQTWISWRICLQPKMLATIQQLCFTSLGANDSSLRLTAAETMGVLARLGSLAATSTTLMTPTSTMANGAVAPATIAVGPRFASDITKLLIDLIVGAAKDAKLRAGATIALASVFKCNASLTNNAPLVRNVLRVVQSLCVDGNSTVHAWAWLARWSILDTSGVGLSSTVGTKEFTETLVSSCMAMLSSGSHQPFWGATRASGDFSPALLDPYRLVLRSCHAATGSLGPEVQSQTGSAFVRAAMSFVAAIDRELVDVYRALCPPVNETASSPVLLPSSLRFQLGVVGMTMHDRNVVPWHTGCLTSCSPHGTVMTDAIRCYAQWVTFGATANLNVHKIMPWLQLQVLPAANHGLPFGAIRHTIKLWWHAFVAGWTGLDKPTLRHFFTANFVVQLLYMLDGSFRQEKIENGSYSGSIGEDEAFSIFSAAGVSATDESPRTHAFVENEVKEIVNRLIKEDIVTHGLPNRWLKYADAILARTTVASTRANLTAIMETVHLPESGKAGGSGSGPGDTEDGDKDNDDDTGGDKNDDDRASENNGQASVEENADDADGGDGADTGEANAEPSNHGGEHSPSKDVGFGPAVMLAGLAIGQMPGAGGEEQSALLRYGTTCVDASIQMSPLPSWRLLFFANYCMLHVMSNVGDGESMSTDYHLDPRSARKWVDQQKKNGGQDAQVDLTLLDAYPLVLKLGELVRLAFNAATTSPVEMVRVVGLNFLAEIIRVMGPLPDPDFPEFSLLEQYQAQINACLSLAFTSSEGAALPFHFSTEVQVVATRVCAEYVASGIGADLASVARVNKILTGLLERAVDLNAFAQGAERSPVAFLWARLLIFAAFARVLTCAANSATGGNSHRKAPSYIVDIVRPHYERLFEGLIRLLQDYNMLKLAAGLVTDAPSDSRPQMSANDMVKQSPLASDGSLVLDHALFYKDILFNQYSRAWSSIVAALSVLLENSPQLLAGKDRSRLFFDVLGQCMETLMIWTSPGFAVGLLKSEQPLASMTMTRTLFGASVAGTELPLWLESEVVGEVLQILDRVVLRERLATMVRGLHGGDRDKVIADLNLRLPLLERSMAFIERFVREHYRGYVQSASASSTLPAIVSDLWKLLFDALNTVVTGTGEGFSFNAKLITSILDAAIVMVVLSPSCSVCKVSNTAFSFHALLAVMTVPGATDIDQKLRQYIKLLMDQCELDERAGSLPSVVRVSASTAVSGFVEEVLHSAVKCVGAVDATHMTETSLQRAKAALSFALFVCTLWFASISSENSPHLQIVTGQIDELWMLVETCIGFLRNDVDNSRRYIDIVVVPLIDMVKALASQGVVGAANSLPRTAEGLRWFKRLAGELAVRYKDPVTVVHSLFAAEVVRAIGDIVCSAAAGERRTALVAAVLPLLVETLGHDACRHRAASQAILRVIGVDALAFKAAVAALASIDMATKERLEKAIRDAVMEQQQQQQSGVKMVAASATNSTTAPASWASFQPTATTSTVGESKPSIELKVDFTRFQ